MLHPTTMNEPSTLKEHELICFGMIAEWAGGPRQQLTLPQGSCVADLRKAVQERWPQLANITYQVAVDQRLANEDTVLESAREIALLPPFAGG